MTENDKNWHICHHKEWEEYEAKPIPTEATNTIEQANWQEILVSSMRYAYAKRKIGDGDVWPT